MVKIAMIGAGSLVFGKTLMSDFLATPALRGSEYRLMALSHKRLDKMRGFVERMIKDNRVEATVTATTDRREDAAFILPSPICARRDASKSLPRARRASTCSSTRSVDGTAIIRLVCRFQ